MLNKVDVNMTGNVSGVIAKQRLICSMIDQGFSIDIPNKRRWHPSHSKDFLQKLNTSSVRLLN